MLLSRLDEAPAVAYNMLQCRTSFFLNLEHFDVVDQLAGDVIETGRLHQGASCTSVRSQYIYTINKFTIRAWHGGF